MKTVIAEPLEQRSLFSVSAATFIGPLTVGTTWTYQSTELASYTLIQKVTGTKKIGGYVAAQVHTVQPEAASVLADDYYVIDPKKGLLNLEEVITGPDNASGGIGTDVITTSPQEIAFPISLAAGKVQKGSYNRDELETDSSGKKTKVVTPFTFTRRLESATRVSITVPAGTFSCYEIYEVVQRTDAKVSAIRTTYYVAPGIGLVESTGANGMELQKFVKGK